VTEASLRAQIAATKEIIEIETQELDETARSSGGFGSTGSS